MRLACDLMVLPGLRRKTSRIAPRRFVGFCENPCFPLCPLEPLPPNLTPDLFLFLAILRPKLTNFALVMNSNTHTRFICDTWEDYELLDSGDAARLDRFGKWVLDRPEPGAVWARGKNYREWDKADVVFEATSKTKGVWKGEGPGSWTVEYQSPAHRELKLKFQLGLTKFKHVGIFLSRLAIGNSSLIKSVRIISF